MIGFWVGREKIKRKRIIENKEKTMDRGFYSAAAGVLSQQKVFSTISNNIANAGTVGYKGKSTVDTSFGEHFVARMRGNGSDANIGTGSLMTVNSAEFTDFSQGSISSTGRSVDLSIQGSGFFVIASETFGEVATRNGQFEIDGDGELALPGVGKVLGQGGGAITLESGNFIVDAAGVIYDLEGEEIDALYIAMGAEGAALKPVGEGFFQCEEGLQEQESEAYGILQGAVEKSNVNMAWEMSKMISAQNQYQSCMQMLRAFDSLEEKCVTQVGQVG